MCNPSARLYHLRPPDPTHTDNLTETDMFDDLEANSSYTVGINPDQDLIRQQQRSAAGHLENPPNLDGVKEVADVDPGDSESRNAPRRKRLIKRRNVPADAATTSCDDLEESWTHFHATADEPNPRYSTIYEQRHPDRERPHFLERMRMGREISARTFERFEEPATLQSISGQGYSVELGHGVGSTPERLPDSQRQTGQMILSSTVSTSPRSPELSQQSAVSSPSSPRKYFRNPLRRRKTTEDGKSHGQGELKPASLLAQWLMRPIS